MGFQACCSGQNRLFEAMGSKPLCIVINNLGDFRPPLIFNGALFLAALPLAAQQAWKARDRADIIA